MLKLYGFDTINTLKVLMFMLETNEEFRSTFAPPTLPA
jgi:hypothetical protein